MKESFSKKSLEFKGTMDLVVFINEQGPLVGESPPKIARLKIGTHPKLFRLPLIVYCDHK